MYVCMDACMYSHLFDYLPTYHLSIYVSNLSTYLYIHLVIKLANYQFFKTTSLLPTFPGQSTSQIFFFVVIKLGNMLRINIRAV